MLDTVEDGEPKAEEWVIAPEDPIAITLKLTQSHQPIALLKVNHDKNTNERTEAFSTLVRLDITFTFCVSLLTY